VPSTDRSDSSTVSTRSVPARLDVTTGYTAIEREILAGIGG